jgi:hypothetical protein
MPFEACTMMLVENIQSAWPSRICAYASANDNRAVRASRWSRIGCNVESHSVVPGIELVLQMPR